MNNKITSKSIDHFDKDLQSKGLATLYARHGIYHLIYIVPRLILTKGLKQQFFHGVVDKHHQRLDTALGSIK